MHKLNGHPVLSTLLLENILSSIVFLPVGIVSLGEAAVDAVVDGGAVVLDDQPGAVAADGVHSEPAALVLPAVAVVQIVRSADRLRHWSSPGGLGRCELWSFRWMGFSINLLLKRYTILETPCRQKTSFEN